MHEGDSLEYIIQAVCEVKDLSLPNCDALEQPVCKTHSARSGASRPPLYSAIFPHIMPKICARRLPIRRVAL
jgi:hypothetical protein